jgi:hypothetical protein
MLFKEGRIIFFFVATLALSAWIVLEGLPKDPTFFRLTDFSKIEALYQPIKNNQNIKIIAAYPMTLSNGESGFLPNFQLVGQIIHEKTLAGGVDPFTLNATKIQKAITDIADKKTIDALTEFGVDTIIIHDKLLSSKDILVQLKADERLIYVGQYVVDVDKPILYLSTNDTSRTISVFQIKKVIEAANQKDGLYADDGQVLIHSTNGYKIRFTVSNLLAETDLYFTQPYSSDWKLYPQKSGFDFWGLAYLFEKPIFDETHRLIGKHGNKWTVSAENAGEIKLTLCFKKQLCYNMGKFISFFVFASCCLFVFVNIEKRRNKQFRYVA